VKIVVPLRLRLFATVLATTLVALALAGGALLVLELRSHRQALTGELDTTAAIVGHNLSEPLISGRADSARQALGALAARSDVVSACLYDGEGTLFADYRRAGGRCPPSAEPATAGFAGNRLVLYHPVTVPGQPCGTLRMEATLAALERQARLSALVLLLVLSAAQLASLLLTAPLRRLVSRPILQLAGTAPTVAQSDDDTGRAREPSAPPLASWAFNRMLARVDGAVLERKKAEEQLLALEATLEERVAERTATAERRAAELERSNEELELFAAMASHDLQEPLRTVACYAQLVRRRLGNRMDPESEVDFDRVLAGVRRMKALIDNLLSYARVGKQALKRAPVDLGVVVDSALADLTVAVAESGAQVTHDPLPTVWGDQAQLIQVVRNLVSNAIRFRGEAPPRIHIGAVSDQGEARWQISVHDNGIGIDPRYKERIFGIFQRLHGGDRPGNGVGLAICRKTIERHGGQIWVDSTPGQGSTFYFTLPAGTADSADQAPGDSDA
jgi:signal transduction histidine kinase